MSTNSEQLAARLALLAYVRRVGPVSISRCAQHFGVSRRAIRDWVSDLWVTGFSGDDSAIYLPPNMVDFNADLFEQGQLDVVEDLGLRPPRPSHRQVEMLSLAVQVAASSGLIEVSEALSLLALLGAEGVADLGPDGGVSALQARHREVVSAAARSVMGVEQVALRIRYQDADLRVSERVVVPLELVASGDASYLRAFCLGRGAERMFVLDRILEAAPAPVSSVGGLEQRDRAPQGVLECSRVSAAMAEELGDPALVSDAPRAVRVPVFSRRWLLGFLMRHGDLVESVGPRSLVQSLSVEFGGGIYAEAS